MVESERPDNEVEVLSFPEDVYDFEVELFVFEFPDYLGDVEYVAIEDVFVLEIIIDFLIAT